MAEFGIDIEYADDKQTDNESSCATTSKTEQKRPISRINELRQLYASIEGRSWKPQPSCADSQSLSERLAKLTIVAQTEHLGKTKKQTRRAVSLIHKASCRNCTKESTCRLAKVRERPCMEWWAKPGCDIKWSDYDVKGDLFGKRY